MKEVPNKADIVICGAGIAGISTAYYLAKNLGSESIVLIDKRPPFTLTSDKSAECYRTWWDSALMVRFMNRSIDLLEQLADESGNVFNMNRRGYCLITELLPKPSIIEKEIKNRTELGLGPIRVHNGEKASSTPYILSKPNGIENSMDGADLILDPEVIQNQYKYLSDHVKAIWHARRCGWLSAQQLGMYLMGQAKNLVDIKVLRGEITGVNSDKRGISEVIVEENNQIASIKTRKFVNAAGPFTKHVGNLLGLKIPIKTILHQKIVIKDNLGIIPRSAPMLIFTDKQTIPWSEEERGFLETDTEGRKLLKPLPGGVYLRPEGGRESTAVLMGWAYDEVESEPEWDPPLSNIFPMAVLRGSTKIAPGLKQYIGKLSKPMHDGGYYTESTNNMPIIGPLDVDGTYIVGGLGGYGIMAGCAAGELASAWVIENELPDYAENFLITRDHTPPSNGRRHSDKF